MHDPNGILEAIAAMPGADLPHIHAPATVGEVVRQIMERHPLLAEATRADVEVVVALTAALGGAHHVAYTVGGHDGGRLGGPGTWASTGAGRQSMLQISGTLPIVFPQDDPAPDPTVLDRADAELRGRVEALGGLPSWVDLLDAERAAFGGEDVITFATPATRCGTDSFHVHLSHNPGPWSPGVEASLDGAARTIVAHRVHADEIRRRLDVIRTRVVRRFGPMGREVGDTLLLGVEVDKDGALASVKAATRVSTLGDAFEPRDAFLQMSEPHDVAKGEVDSFRILSRDTRRRLAALGGRDPLDAYAMCPVAARDHATLTGAAAADKAADIRRAMNGREGGRDVESKSADFIDGRLTDTVRIAEGVTFRNRRLMARGVAPPDSVLITLPGRPLTDIVPDPRLEGLVVEKAAIDSKGRFNVTVRPTEGVPLRAELEALEARR